MNSKSKLHVGIPYAVHQHQKDLESELIAKQIKAFQAKGGVIEKLERSARSAYTQYGKKSKGNTKRTTPAPVSPVSETVETVAMQDVDVNEETPF